MFIICQATHDSIGLGEDGPTHQPIETAVHLRAIPNLDFWRPADGNETSAAYYVALKSTETPSVFSLSRQNLPNLVMKFAGDSSALTLLRRDELRRKALQFLLRANYLSKTKLRLMFQAQEPPHRHTGESDAAQYGEHQENEQLHPK